MAREITPAATTAATAPVVRPLALVRMVFDSGVVTLWTGRGDLVWNSETYTGVGGLGRIGAIDEGADQQAYGIAFTLSGVDAAFVSIALDEDVQGRECRVWLGLFDDALALVADPVEVFSGRLDTMSVKLGSEGVIEVTAESRMIDWQEPRERRFTDADQRECYPGDAGFEFLNETVDKEVLWGPFLVGGRGGGSVAQGISRPGRGGPRGDGHENSGRGEVVGPGGGGGQ